MAKEPKSAPMSKKQMEAAALKKRIKRVCILSAPPLAFFGYPTLMVAIGGMLPTLVAFIVDNRPERFAARTVGYLNLSGVFIVCLDMWSGDHTWQAALELLYEPINWLIMFGTAALGWLLYFILPPISAAYLTVSNDLKMKSLVSDQDKLTKEWGNGVSRNAPGAPAEENTPDASATEHEDPQLVALQAPDSSEEQAPKSASVPSMADIGQSAAP